MTVSAIGGREPEQERADIDRVLLAVQRWLTAIMADAGVKELDDRREDVVQAIMKGI